MFPVLKNLRIQLNRLAAVLAFLLLAGAGLPVQAHADSASPRGCVTGYWYDITSKTGIHMWDGKTWYKDGPGGTITTSVTQDGSVSSTATGSGSFSVGGIVAQAKIEVSSSVTNSTTVTKGHTYTHDVAADKYGNLRYGSWGYYVGWARYYDSATCTTTKVAYGTARISSVALGWRYYATSS